MATYWEKIKNGWHLALFQISYPRKWQLIRACPIGILGLEVIKSGSHLESSHGRMVRITALSGELVLELEDVYLRMVEDGKNSWQLRLDAPGLSKDS